MAVRSLVIATTMSACAGTYGGQPPAHGPQHAPGIEAAALPYAIVDARTGHAVDTAAFWSKLATERAVCVGEEHSNPHHHWIELEVAKHLLPAWHHGALGLEMIQRPFQGVLDDFAAKRIDDVALRSRVGWEERWGYDFGFYAPTIAVALGANAALVALDASTELTKQVAHHGIASLSSDQQAQLPELDLHDAKHRAWFDALMADMGGSEAHAHAAHAPSGSDAGSDADAGGDDDAAEMPSADDIYAVQVIWDETMADTAAKWLAAHPDGHILILAGTGHCHDSAIVGRLKRRGIADVVSVRTVSDSDVSDALVAPINDFLVVLRMPAADSHTR
ncbi:MAG TPA: ChaN family lipoprotein [Kofleriaceae bacterium]|jgi:uncharacterized iron-regulated protein